MATSGNLAPLLLLGLTIGFVQGEKTAGHDWGYYGSNVAEDEKPARWRDYFPQCGGKKQSPIHIHKSEVVYKEDLGDFKFEGYDDMPTDNFTMSNNGHTLVFAVNTEHYLSEGGLDGKYKLVQFHLHWGSGNNNGSEHLIDEINYAGEIHLVHYNTKYATFADAVAQDDGLAVLGTNLAVEGGDNENFADIIKHLDDVPYADSPSVQVMPFPLKQAMPLNHDVFYRYPGSLTTPPCYESVTWTVYENHISVSQAQINLLRSQLHHSVEAESGTSEDYNLKDNHRTLQELHGRTIHTNAPVQDPSAAHRVGGTVLSLVVAAVLGLLL